MMMSHATLVLTLAGFAENVSQRLAQNLFMIERQWWRTPHRMPACFIGIVSTGGLCAAFKQSDISDAHRMAARVAARITECTELFKANSRKPSLFLQFAGCRLFK